MLLSCVVTETLSKVGCHLAPLIFKKLAEVAGRAVLRYLCVHLSAHLSATHFLRRSYFHPRRDELCIISILIHTVGQTAGVRTSPRGQTTSAVRECWFPLRGCRTPLPRPLINRNKSRLLYVTRDGCTFISLFMRYNLNTWAGVINADTHSDAGSLLDNRETARVYAQPQTGLIYIIFSLFTKETAKRSNRIPRLNKCSVLHRLCPTSRRLVVSLLPIHASMKGIAMQPCNSVMFC